MPLALCSFCYLLFLSTVLKKYTEISRVVNRYQADCHDMIFKCLNRVPRDRFLMIIDYYILYIFFILRSQSKHYFVIFTNKRVIVDGLILPY